MFKFVHDKVWVFDVEWVPDPIAGRKLYKLPDSMSDEEIIHEMWKEGGATADDPMPYLKTTLCRVVSISFVTRYKKTDADIEINLHSLPADPTNPELTSEKNIIETFLQTLGKRQAQLIGFNSLSSDLRILIQRGVAHGIEASQFCSRPDKPWQGIDYFSAYGDWNIDLIKILGGWGKSTPSLNEMAVVSGIPGKMGIDGQEVAPLWLSGGLDKIIAYNEFDALTTYLLWLRLAHFAGFFGTEQYEEEQELLRQLLITESEKPERSHLKDYLKEWERLK
ncbi:3'-5' exonuclease [bacterium]|nr:3'-5' exonuclease [bacterium]